ncbi:MAG: 4-hydroxy-3-methylbut-2-enyl diphosphate reductase [Actinobacteria bacterium]|nr:4-hydroxy-3-methylbut-2-enyl diphosphate reductase [Actinomycetota bacterium]
MRVDKILLASPRGFCAGVDMATTALEWMLRIFEPPVWCYHEIVHNVKVVENFKAKGVIFVDDIDEVPKGAPLMLSAHGSAPQLVEASRAKAGILVNAVCPLVTKVHHEVKTRSAKGYQIIYIAHHNHDEAIGTTGVAPNAIHLIENMADMNSLIQTHSWDLDTPIALITQTTLSQDECREIKARAIQSFPRLWAPKHSDLCFATTNRQTALKEIAKRCDTVIVIGSENSSNTIALEKVAKAQGCKNVLRIDNTAQIPQDLHATVGITASASAPEDLVDEVIAYLSPRNGVEEVQICLEEEYFPLPLQLRNLLKALTTAVEIATLAPVSP